MKPLFLILLVVMNLLWAASYSAFKALAPHLSSGQIATWRYLIAALVLLLFWPILPGKPPVGRDLVRTAVMGVIVFAVGMRCQIAASHIGRAGDVSLLVALDPLVVAVAAALFLGERLAPRRWGGFFLGMSGVVLMAEVWRPEFRAGDLLFSGLILVNLVCETAYSIMGKPLLARVGLLKLVALAFLSGSLANLALELILSGAATFTRLLAMPLAAWLILLYLALICSAVGYSLWYLVIRETQVSVSALTIFLQPIAGLIIAMIWLGESPHWGQLWGSGVIVLGLVLGLARSSGPKTYS